VRHLITHTAGFGYWIWDADIDHYEQVTGIANVMPGTIDVFKAPMVFDPGTRFEYGISVDWLGQVIEAVSGLPLDTYFLEHITGPLGMTNTTARMTPEQRANSTPVHVRGEDGAWVATDVDWAQQPDYWGGGHFLYSTPRDFLKLQQMLLGCGTLGDVPTNPAAAFDRNVRDDPQRKTAMPERLQPDRRLRVSAQESQRGASARGRADGRRRKVDHRFRRSSGFSACTRTRSPALPQHTGSAELPDRVQRVRRACVPAADSP